MANNDHFDSEVSSSDNENDYDSLYDVIPAEKIRSIRNKCHLTYISAISLVGFFPSSEHRSGPRRGYLQKGL